MTGEVLTLIVIIAGTTAGTITCVAMKRKNSTTGMVGSIEGGRRLVMVHRPSATKGMEWALSAER